MTSIVNPIWWARLFVAGLPWYLSMQLLALAALPLTFRICTRLYDRGYALAKVIGLVLTAYVTWLLAHGMVPFGFDGVAAAACIVGLASIVSAFHVLGDMRVFVRRHARLLLVYEAVFAAAFVLMLAVRAQVPQITYVISDSAAEKFTDFAVLNGLLTSRFFPPHDAWLSGFTMNYYYFGHFLWACLTKLTASPPELAFNFALAGIFAYVCLQSLSLGYNLTRRVGWGLLAVFLVAFSSNIDGFLQLVAIITGRLLGTFSQGPWYGSYDFWRSSRAIENTINEFPAFSFILGDLHAHLSSLVVFLGAANLSIQVWRSAARQRSLLRYEMWHLDELFLAVLIAGALFAANSWDAISFAALLAVVLWIGRRGDRDRPFPGDEPDPDRAGRRVLYGLESALLVGVLFVAGVSLLFRPFLRNFVAPFPREAPLKLVDPANRSSSVEFLVHWVMLLLPPLVLMSGLYRRYLRALPGMRPGGSPRWSVPVAQAGCAISVTLVMFTVTGGWVSALMFTAASALLVALIAYRQPPTLRLLLGLLLVFSVVTCFCELFCFNDIFSQSEGVNERINTVFKLYYGLWPLMALAAVLSLKRLARYAPAPFRRRRIVIPATFLLLLGGVYPIAGTMQRIAHTQPQPTPVDAREALDGMRYLRFAHPDDYAAIEWLRRNSRPDTRILESVGKQYEYNGRISTNTGRPAYGGWLYHEWGWRGDRWITERDRRIQTAQIIYQTSSSLEAMALLQRDKIQLVVVGDQEREVYPELNEQTFEKIGRLVFREGHTSIYLVDFGLVDFGTTETTPRLHENLADPSNATDLKKQ
jgi:YYY domain-containing protein